MRVHTAHCTLLGFYLSFYYELSKSSSRDNNCYKMQPSAQWKIHFTLWAQKVYVFCMHFKLILPVQLTWSVILEGKKRKSVYEQCCYEQCCKAFFFFAFAFAVAVAFFFLIRDCSLELNAYFEIFNDSFFMRFSELHECDWNEFNQLVVLDHWRFCIFATFISMSMEFFEIERNRFVVSRMLCMSYEYETLTLVKPNSKHQIFRHFQFFFYSPK